MGHTGVCPTTSKPNNTPVEEINNYQLRFQVKMYDPNLQPSVRFVPNDLVMGKKVQQPRNSFSAAWTGHIVEVLYEIDRDGNYTSNHVDHLRPASAGNYDDDGPFPSSDYATIQRTHPGQVQVAKSRHQFTRAVCSLIPNLVRLDERTKP